MHKTLGARDVRGDHVEPETDRSRGTAAETQMVRPEPECPIAIRQAGQCAVCLGIHAAQRATIARTHRQHIQRRIGECLRAPQFERLAPDPLRWPELRDAALVQRRGVTAQQQCLGGLCGRVNHHRRAIRKEPWQFRAQVFAELVVKVGERLVEKHQPRFFHQRARQRHALLLATGELEWFALEIRPELKQFRHSRHLAVYR